MNDKKKENLEKIAFTMSLKPDVSIDLTLNQRLSSIIILVIEANSCFVID